MRPLWKKWALRAAAIFGGVLTLFALLVLAAVYTPPGHAVVARLIGPLSGGEVAVSGLSGNLFHHMRARNIALRDADGVWLTAEDVALDWRALSLFDEHVEIAQADAGRIVVLRRPLPRESSSSSWRIDIARFYIARIEAAQAAIGHKAVLTASGSLHYVSMHDAAADIAARRLDEYGQYRVNASIGGGIVRGTATILEAGNGFAGGAIGLPDLGPVSLKANAAEDRSVNSIAFELHAGALDAQGRGAINLAARQANIDVTASAPAMRPRPGLGWASFAMTAHMSGAFDRPAIDAKLSLADLTTNGFSASHVEADLHGDAGTAALTADADNLMVPGANPNLFAAAPVKITANVQLDTKARRIVFALDHPLLHVEGGADTRGTFRADANVRVASLAPFAALGGVVLEGRANFNVKAAEESSATTIALTGTMDAAGDTTLARLLGHRATVNLSAALHGAQIVSAQAAIAGQDAAIHASGASPGGALDYRWDVSIANISDLAPTILGTLDLRGVLTGKIGNAHLAASGKAFAGTKHFAKQIVNINLDADGLPNAPRGRFSLNGKFNGAPIAADGNLTRDRPGMFAIALRRADWKSVHAEGKLDVPESKGRLGGAMALRVGNLADLAPLLDANLSGTMAADADFQTMDGKDIIKLRATAQNAHLAGMGYGRFDLGGSIADPFARPVLALTAHVEGLQVQGFTGTADAGLTGPLEKIAIHLSSDSATQNDARLSFTAAADANMKTKKLALHELHGTWLGQKFALLAPATINFANGIAVDHLTASFATARLELAGKISPDFALTLSATGVTPDMLQPYIAPHTLEGTLSFAADIRGTAQNPVGSFTLTGRDLRLRGLSARSFPPSVLDAHGTLRNFVVALDAKMSGGNSLQFALKGDVPLEPDYPLALQASGSADLAIAGAFLAASGQSLSGKLSMNAQIGGTLSSPRATGNIQLAGGEFRDYTRGVRLREIEAAGEAQGDVIRITKFNARAGQGSISGTGTIGLPESGMPVDMQFTARNARPLVSDRLTATLDADLKLAGRFGRDIALSGSIRVSQGEINVPDKYPPGVAVLDVRRKGQSAPARTESDTAIALDLAIAAPARVFVRGRGLDAELAGNLAIKGTTNAPQVLGALDMRRGTLSLAGQTLVFRSGTVSFDGNGLKTSLDPTLDFVAETNSGGITATLNVTGYASAPQIKLSSTPPLPQDEVIARILFQQSIKQLTALQLAQIAEALASLSGVGTGFNPVGMLRKTLGLDRLSVDSTSTGNAETSTTTIEAGKYVAHDVYVGARQDLSGGTRAIVEIDITKNLKAQAAVNTGATAVTTPPGTTPADTGDSVGLSYQFEY